MKRIRFFILDLNFQKLLKLLFLKNLNLMTLPVRDKTNLGIHMFYRPIFPTGKNSTVSQSDVVLMKLTRKEKI
jgi:hypothetical protein